jgi:hypothetical protein
MQKVFGIGALAAQNAEDRWTEPVTAQLMMTLLKSAPLL